MFKKNTLDQVADLVVTQLKHHTQESNWLCNVVPVEIDSGLCHNFDCTGSICLSFGDEKSQYEARISKLSEKNGKKRVSTSTVKSSSTEFESQLSELLENQSAVIDSTNLLDSNMELDVNLR